MKKYKNYILPLIIVLFLIMSFSSIINAELLQRGDRNKGVESIQQKLAYIGYNIDVDGIYGPKTEQVVKKFQDNNGLAIDGIVGENTRNTLKNVSESKEYNVKNGDSLWDIANKFNTTVDTIKKINNLNSNIIRQGQTIYIPQTGSGGVREVEQTSIIHKVQRGDCLSRISKKYGISIEKIKLANNLRSNIIHPGQELVIPHSISNKSFDIKEDNIIWPVLGRITSGFGSRTHPISGQRDFHSGIDIAVPVGTEIRAAAPGKVITSDWRGGYGKTVIIDHGNNVKTLYAHNSKLKVSTGSNVYFGDVIALAGSTGVSTGPHLHFELIINGEEVEPRNYLP